MAFRNNTVFIVGAGASCEFGMPSGAELADSIRKGALIKFGDYGRESAGDEDLREVLLRSYSSAEVNQRVPALRQIASGIYMAETIDAYIERHREVPFVEEMGKFLIAFYILRGEAHSKLVVEPGSDGVLDLPSLGDTWINHFGRALMAGVAAGQVDGLGAEITIVCFNYDRCIERYLQEAIRQAYNIGAAQADLLVRRVRILRPYGDLGTLPPSPRGAGHGHVPFGADPSEVDLPKIAAGVRTFHERITDAAMLEDIRTRVATAERIVFLGFGYHAQNIALMQAPMSATHTKRFYYSGYGIPDQAVDGVIESTVNMAMSPQSIPSQVNFERGQKAAHVMSVFRTALT